MRSYVTTLWRLPQMTATTEPSVAPTQMHSLRSFWWLLIPWSELATVVYIVSSIGILILAVKSWNSSGPLEMRFSVLILASVLVNPHLFIYDLLVLAPVLLLVTNWTLQHPDHQLFPALKVTLYLSYLLPLFGPLAIWTHMQLSVLVFVAMSGMLWHILGTGN
jgi:hypothetical protein